MKYINHITLNTGHTRKTYPSEIDKASYFKLRRVFNESLSPDGAELFDGYRTKTTSDSTGTIATVFASDGAPVLTTLISKFGKSSAWKALHDTATPKLPLTPEPEAPYIADRLDIGAMLHPDALRWTGDFARCFGWIVVDPRKIR